MSKNKFCIESKSLKQLCLNFAPLQPKIELKLYYFLINLKALRCCLYKLVNSGVIQILRRIDHSRKHLIKFLCLYEFCLQIINVFLPFIIRRSTKKVLGFNRTFHTAPLRGRAILIKTLLGMDITWLSSWENLLACISFSFSKDDLW